MISAVTNSYPAMVTTAVDHQYITGITVRLLIPEACGMQQLNNYLGKITYAGPDTFTIDIDTTYFDAFVIPGISAPAVSDHIDTCAQVLPIGEDPYQITAPLRNILG
jgi:hypothetical protein